MAHYRKGEGLITMLIRTDLAAEAHEMHGEMRGVTAETDIVRGYPITTVRVTTREAARVLSKPVGTYITISLGSFLRREDNAFATGAQLIAESLRQLLPSGGTALVAGLGNPAITPDSVGHIAVANTLVTRHLRGEMLNGLAGFGDVAALEPGVLGSTGIESVTVLSAVVREIRPSCVIAVDALASRSIDRVCSTVQLSDSGIVPGSGVGNARKELSRGTLGVPVIAVGSPTVVDAATLLSDLAVESGTQVDEQVLRRQAPMIVTPKDIDSKVRDISRLIGYGINLALHSGISVADIDMFLG